VRYSRIVAILLGLGQLARAMISRPLKKRLEKMGDSYRVMVSAHMPQLVEPLLRRFVEDPQRAQIWREQRIGWERYNIDVNNPIVTKGLVLKAPGNNGEKGVLLLSFEYNWPPLLLTRNTGELLRRFTVICSPSWSPTHFQTYWSLAHLPDADIFFMIANQSDLKTFRRMRTGTGVLPLLGCDWINPDDYQPRPHSTREIDILMIANWAPFKRHWVLFRALREIKKNLRIVLVGQPEAGRTLEHVAAEAEWFGVRDRIEFHNSLNMDQVTAMQCNSRVQLVLSRREGYCNCVAESFFADTPVGLVKDAHMGPAVYMNSLTGVFLDERHFARDLTALLDRSDTFRAREWAMTHIRCHDSIKTMNNLLREHALAKGQPWTRDACVFGWRPDPRYIRPEDRQSLLPAYQELKERYGLVFRT
jgi:glycosyltransferase involved in cell wall biosynthesis